MACSETKPLSTSLDNGLVRRRMVEHQANSVSDLSSQQLTFGLSVENPSFQV